MADASLNPAVLAFTTALALVTGLVFGLVPALAVMRGNTNTLLKDDTARGSAGRGTGLTRAALVDRRDRARAGAARRRRAADQELRAAAGGEPRLLGGQRAHRAARAAGDALSGRGRARARSGRASSSACATLPGVTAVGLTSNVPFNGMVGSGSYSIVGYTPPQGEAQPHGRQEIVGGDYFRRCRSRSSPAVCSPTPTPPTARSS